MESIIKKLENEGLYTQAFSKYYFEIEDLTREVIKIGKIKSDTEELFKDISKILSKKLILMKKV